MAIFSAFPIAGTRLSLVGQVLTRRLIVAGRISPCHFKEARMADKKYVVAEVLERIEEYVKKLIDLLSQEF